MAGVTGSEFLQIAIFAGVIGLGFFCLSYAVLVWSKRNALGARFGRARRVALALFVLGGLATGAILGTSALTRRQGVVDGSDLFVVHARPNALVRLTDANTVDSGNEIASFMPAGIQSRREMLELQSAKAAAAREAIKAKPIEIDQALLQEQAHLRYYLADQERNRLDLQRSARELEKARSALLTSWTRERKELEASIATAEISVGAARDLGRLAKGSLDRVTEGRQRELIPFPELEKRRASMIEVEASRQKEQGAQDLLQQRLNELARRYRESDDQFAGQLSNVEAQTRELSARVDHSDAQLQEVTNRLAQDRERAERARSIDVQAAELQASLAATEAKQQAEVDRVQAPFGGQVVYRHPAPALAREGTPILAIAPGSGFIARVPLPKDEAEQLMARSADVTMALDQPVLARLFSARLKTVEPMPSEADRVLGIFEARLPAELVDYLGQPGQPVRFQLLWRPNVLDNPHMRVSLAASLLGLLGLIALGGRHRQPESPDPLPAPVQPEARPSVVRNWDEAARAAPGRRRFAS